MLITLPERQFILFDLAKNQARCGSITVLTEYKGTCNGYHTSKFLTNGTCITVWELPSPTNFHKTSDNPIFYVITTGCRRFGAVVSCTEIEQIWILESVLNIENCVQSLDLA